MNRRSILRLLGIAPLAAPAVMAAASQEVVVSVLDGPRTITASIPPIKFEDGVLTVAPINYDSFARAESYRIEHMSDGSSRFVIVAEPFYVKGGQASA